MTSNPVNGATRRQNVQSAEMGLTVLRKLASMGGAASITALAAQLQENPAKVHRYLVSLVETGFVYQDAESLRYVLGPESIFIGLVAQRQAEPLRAAVAELPAVLDALNVTCFVALMGENGPLIVRWDDPSQPVIVSVRVGSVLPVLWSATGRIFAAFAPSERLDELIKLELKSASPAQRTQVPSVAAARKLIDEVRGRGIAAVEGTVLAGISGFAVPVLNAGGRAVASMGALGVSGSFDNSVDGPNADALKAAAARASHRLGFGAGA